MRRFVRLSSIIIIAFVMIGCEDMGFGDSERFKQDFHYNYPLKPGNRLDLENMNGSIEISPWEKDEVDISGTKYASTKEMLDALKVDVAASSDSVRIRTIGPSTSFSHMGGNRGARYVIRVPKRTTLDRIASTNGSIRVNGVEGVARLRTSNGAIRTAKLRGELEAQTTNGAVEIEDQSGNSSIRTSNGSVRADMSRGSFTATTTNGNITARINEPDPSHMIKLDSSNGHIELTLDAVNNSDVRVGTTNSSITLHIPSPVNARLRANTSNSSITSDFDVLVKGGVHSKSHLEGTIGNGGPLIDLSTSNGGIKIVKL